MKKQNGSALLVLIVFGVWLLAAGGWIANVVKLAGMDFGAVTGMLVLRAIGVVAMPLGAVLGFV